MLSRPDRAAGTMVSRARRNQFLALIIALCVQLTGAFSDAVPHSVCAAVLLCKGLLSAGGLEGAVSLCDSVNKEPPLSPFKVDPEVIAGPVARLLGWQIPFLDNVDRLLPSGASDNAISKMRDSRSWIWGAMLIGMADWASVSNNVTLWDWLQVRSRL